MNILKKTDSKIYICCPSGVVTGGVELLHQLADVLSNNGRNAFLVYYGNAEHKIPDSYKKYNVHLAEKIEDINDNIVVLPETMLHLSFGIKKAALVYWWLSVDNFFFGELPYLSIKDLFGFNKKLAFVQIIKRPAKRVLRGKAIKFSFKQVMSLPNIVCNAYQSEYAKDFLNRNGFTNTASLKDFINDDYLSVLPDEKAKEDIVAYNPMKGFKFTRKLIKADSSINWVAIQNMTRSQVKDLLLRAKVYVDFGNHPGKDRIPREAAMCKCCIITGKQGSAKFFGDVPIDENKYKFDQKTTDAHIITKTIKSIFENYNKAIKDYEDYRKMILGEKEEFEQDAIKLFSTIGGGYSCLTKFNKLLLSSCKEAA